MKISIIVPIYNEINTIKKVLEGLKKIKLGIKNLHKEIIIIESNSTDGTRKIVKEYEKLKNFRIIYENKPKGKGYAVRKGIKIAKGDILIIQDGDLEYSFRDYPKLIKPILKNKTDFVLGSRHKFLNPFKMRIIKDSPIKAFVLNSGHIILQILFNIIYDQKLNDIFTMYKVFKKNCLSNIRLKKNKFDFDMELVSKLIKNGYKPLEIPIKYKSRGWDQGKKYSIIKDTPAVIWTIISSKFN